MNLLRKIFSPPVHKTYKTQENFTLPYGITEGDWKNIQRLLVSEDFEVLRKTLDKVVNSYAEAMLATEDISRLHFLRGKITGIRFALEIVDEIHKKEQDFLINARRREDAGTKDPRAGRNATFGTPAWNSRRAQRS